MEKIKGLSLENLEKMQKVFDILLNSINLISHDRKAKGLPHKISLKPFEREGLYYDTVETIIKIITALNKSGYCLNFFMPISSLGRQPSTLLVLVGLELNLGAFVGEH